MKRVMPLFLILFCLSMLSACAPSGGNGGGEEQETQADTTEQQEANSKDKSLGLEPGDTAPDFELMNIDSTMVSLASYEDINGYIVIFTCNHCPYAVAYEDRIIELHNTFAPQGYPVVAINPNDPEIVPDDSFENMKVRAAEKDFPFKYLFDAEQTVFPAYGATRTPHVFLLDKDRVVQYIGAIDDNHSDAAAVEVKYLEDAIEALQEGQSPDPATTKAIGCTIKKA